MQVLKKIYFIALCLFVASCSSTQTAKDGSDIKTDSSEVSVLSLSPNEKFKVGMLLPLSGSDAKYGIGLKNASMLALNSINNPNLIIQYYDTASTPSGARVAVENAINQHSDLIIGPLKSTEVQAISNETIYQGIPVIAFSTSQEVLQPTVYTMGLLIDEQVDRIMTYAAEKGRKRFALLIPDNTTGAAVARAAVKSAQKNNVQLTTIGFYQPGTSDFSDIAKEMTDYGQRHARVVRIKSQLQNAANNGDEKAQRSLKELETREGFGDVGFDALIIPETGPKLTAAIAMFAYYDAAYPDVQFLGTSIWESAKLSNEATFTQSLYPSLAHDKMTTFASQYYSVFNERPSSLYTLAYDAVYLANQLSFLDMENINDSITNLNGFNSLSGKIRFFKDGSNQHTLDIIEIHPQENVVVDKGSRYFETISEPLSQAVIGDDYVLPNIYGKDSSLAQLLIYGQVIAQDTFAKKTKDKEETSPAAE
ncbi:MAG: penicillin-binding protein activator [Alphaproteobacteria bacterium]|nr:penicillin-binding protein activator [Alphaproteobacteria bacterium]